MEFFSFQLFLFIISSSIVRSTPLPKWNFECDETRTDICSIKLKSSIGATGSFPNASKFKEILSLELLTNETLNEIPSKIFETFPALRKIRISANIKELASSTFSVNSENLNTLSLERNHIERIPRATFSSLQSLTDLNLPENEIETIEDGAFDGLKKLKNLNLNHNKLQTINQLTFSGLDNIDYIDLRWNQIDTIETDAFKSETLFLLELEGNQLKEINQNAFVNSKKLETILLPNNLLENLNFNLSQSVKYLNVSHNPIRERIDVTEFLRGNNLIGLCAANTTKNLVIGPAMGKSFKLNILDISMNNLTDGDVLLHQLQIFSQLDTLNIELNNFKTIYDLKEFQKNLKKLRKFGIGCNRFKCDWLREQINDLDFKFESLRCDVMAKGKKQIKGVDCLD